MGLSPTTKGAAVKPRPLALLEGSMDILPIFAVVVPSAVSAFHAYLAYKRAQEPKRDPVWDAALQITLHSCGGCDADIFAENYELLSAFKENGCSLHGEMTIRRMIKTKHQGNTEPPSQRK